MGTKSQKKNWKDELVIIYKIWYSDDTLPEEIPPTSFEVARGWKKPTLENYDEVLIQELILLANLPIIHRHWRVLLSQTAFTKCRYLADYSPDSSKIDELDPFAPRDLDEAT